MTLCLVTGLLQCLITEHYALEPTSTLSIYHGAYSQGHQFLQPTSTPSIHLYVAVISHRNIYSLTYLHSLYTPLCRSA
jgi:hypothetical protein